MPSIQECVSETGAAAVPVRCIADALMLTLVNSHLVGDFSRT